MRVPGKLTDSTGGTASETCDDTTASVKDDMASIILKVNDLIDTVIALAKRLEALES